MPGSSRSSTDRVSAGARLAVVAGIVALVLFIIVLTTGGFAIAAGPLRLSVHRWSQPLGVAVFCSALGFLLAGRNAMSSAANDVLPWFERHSTSLVLVVAAATAGVGVAFGTFAASGSDAAGYLSQARLFSTGGVSFAEPLAPEANWPDALTTLSPLGYKPGVTAGEIVPTYPPGLPLLMGAFPGADPLASYLVVPALGAVAVCAVFALGRALQSGVVGLAAALLVATSPIFLFQLVQPMSDVPATAWWTVALVLALAPTPSAALAAGAATGLALLTRPNLLPLALVVLAVTLRSRTSTPQRLSRFVAGVAPAIAALLLLQWRLYGSPWTSGYGDAASLFTMSNVMPNAGSYALRLIRGEAASLTLAGLLLLMLLFGHSSRIRSAGNLRQAVLVAGAMSAGVLLCYLPYAQFDEWFYLRFLLPAFPAVLVLLAALLVRALALLPAGVRGVTFVIAVSLVACFNVTAGAREQAFAMRDFEARYRLAGRYLEAAAAPAAVIVSAQHSGSLHHYAGRPVLRWDLFNGDLDQVVSDLRARGHQVLIVVEDWEAAALKARFPSSTVAALASPPKAEVLGATRVGIFDTADALPAGDGTPWASVTPQAHDVLSFGRRDLEAERRAQTPWPVD